MVSPPACRRAPCLVVAALISWLGAHAAAAEPRAAAQAAVHANAAGFSGLELSAWEAPEIGALRSQTAAPRVGPVLAAEIHPGVRVNPIRGTEELTATARALLRCWFKELDTRCFWSHISVEARYLRRAPEWYSIIFTEGGPPPRPETVKFTPADQSQAEDLKEEGYACMNDSAADGFCVLPGAFWYALTRHEFGGGWSGWDGPRPRKKEYMLPDDAESRVVMFSAEGEGYQSILLAILWVKEPIGWRARMIWGDV